MKSLLIASIVMLGMPWSGAAAASRDESYLAARDASIKAFEQRKFESDSDYDEHKRALADLEAQLREVIGQVAIQGFSADGKINLDTLVTGDERFGVLDGLVYSAPDGKAHVLVTTATLFDGWLRAHKDWWQESPLPADMRAALKRDDFYTQALTDGAAVVAYAEIPVTKPAWATLAVAVLDARTQDAAPRVPDEMIITVRGADRVFIITTKTAVKAGPIAACDRAHARKAKQAEAVSKAYEKSGRKDDALHEKASRAEHAAEWAHPDCFATEARRAGFFPTLVKQAQVLIEALPPK